MFPPPLAGQPTLRKPKNPLALSLMQELEALDHVPGPRLPSRSSLAKRHIQRPYDREPYDCEPLGVTSSGQDPTAQRSNYRGMEFNLKSNSRKRGSGATGSPTSTSERRPTTAPLSSSTSSLDRLAHPKYPPKKVSVTFNRLFGKNGILPLQSPKRAKSRSEAATSRRSDTLHRITEKKNRRSQPVRSGNTSKGLITPYESSFRRIAWDDDKKSTSVVAFARHAVDVRRRQRPPSPPLSSEPEPEPETRDRLRSEDSISTDILVHGNAWGITEGMTMERQVSGSWVDGSSDNGMTREAFFVKFREVANTKQSNPSANVSSVEEENVRSRARQSAVDSPRISDALKEATAKFLRQLSDQGRAPWPALLKLGSATHALEVGGMGLGDDLAAALATVMPILPGVERLVACDNRLTDFSLFRIIKAVQGMPSLTYLDLSENKVGALAAHELQRYMRSKHCRLRCLAIRKADIDDYECREFMQALKDNISLLDMDLTANLIGVAETIHVIGGKSVAAMLSVNNTLTNLNLGWNSIRMASAVVVANSLRSNHALLTLGLAHNSFGDYPSQILAAALCENDTLTRLDLSYNSVTPAAAMVLAFSLKVNKSVKFMELEGNRIGQNGGEALVMAMRTSVRSEGNLIVSVKNCDTSHHDESLFNCNNSTGEYTLDLKVPYQKVVASELLRLANGKTMAHIRKLEHIVGKKVTKVNLHREYIARAQRNPRAEVENLIKRDLAAKDGVQVKHLMEYTKVINLTPELEVAMKITEKWNENMLRDKARAAQGGVDREGGDFVSRCLFEAFFLCADEDAKGDLTIDDLEKLFQGLGMPYSASKMRHVMTKYDTDQSGSIDLDEFTHYMTVAHLKADDVDHGVLCTSDKKKWEVPDHGILTVDFLEELNAHRSIAETCTDRGVEGLINNIQQATNDDDRKRLFELATANHGTYFTASQAQGMLEAVSTIYHVMDAVMMLVPQLVSSQECSAFVDSNLDHRAKLKLRYMVGGAWGAIVGMPSGHYSLDMQNARDRLIAQKVAAVSNQERQNNKFIRCTNTSQTGNWHNFRNAEYNREPLNLHPTWFVNPPKYGILRFDYVSTSRPDHHQVNVSPRRFQRMLARLGLSTPITCNTPIDEDIIPDLDLKDLCSSHWRKFLGSSPLFKVNMRDYFRSGSSLDDVSLASWWSIVNVTSVDLERKHSFAHLTPSETYVKAWYKLRELEVALCSACLTTDQLAEILQIFPRECQIRAEVVIAFYHVVTDIENMCLLVDALRPDEQREVFARRGFLNVVNPVFPDRYYRLDLSMWDEREMAKILIRLAITEPGENWIDETYERKVELGPLPGWELPLDWTSPDTTAEKKDGGPRRMGILTLWYSSAAQLDCSPNIRVRQDLKKRTICNKAGSIGDGAETTSSDLREWTVREQKRFRGMVDKSLESRLFPTEEIAQIFSKRPLEANLGYFDYKDRHAGGGTVFTAASSITSIGDDESSTKS